MVAYEMWSQPGGSTVFHTTDVRWGVFIENLTTFLRVIANIPIQTLILSPCVIMQEDRLAAGTIAACASDC